MTFREIKEASGLTLTALSNLLSIPRRTLEEWNAGRRIPPEYVTNLIFEFLKNKGLIES